MIRTINALRKGVAAVDGSVAYVLGYRTTGDGGGGIYVYHDTSKARDDGGAIIKSNGLPGAWIHEVKDKVVNLKWWGIQPLSYIPNTTSYNLAQDDIFQEFNAAITFIHTRARGSQLLIEAGEGGVWGNGTYYCSGTWQLSKEIWITGTKAGIGYPTTQIIWDARKLCINVPVQAGRATLEHLGVSQLYGDFNFGDSTGHGIYSRAQLYIDNMKFTNLSGDGIRIEACAIPNDPIFGQADFSILKNVAVNYTNHGLYIRGCDANKITVDKFEASNTRRWGVYDDGFLGNDYKEPHFSATGYAGNNNKTSVTYNGKYYQARYQMEGIDNTNKRPDLHPEHWNDVGAHAAVPWRPNTRYWSAGTFALINENAWHMITSPYTEEGQAPGYLNTRSELRNGTRGTGTIGGSQSRTLFGTQYNNANHQFPGVLAQADGGAYETPNAPIHAVQDFKKSGMQDIARFESMNNEAWVKIKNTSGEGYLNLDGKTIKLYSVDGNYFGVNGAGLEVKSLGLSTSDKILTWDEKTKKIGYRIQATSVPGARGGVSQSAFDALQAKVDKLERILGTTASRLKLGSLSDALEVINVKVNKLTTGPNNQPNAQLVEIVSDIQALIDYMKNE